MTLPNHTEPPLTRAINELAKAQTATEQILPLTKALLHKWIVRCLMIGWVVGWIMGFTTGWFVK